MKNVKELLNTIKGLDKKKKAIIAGSTAGVVTIGVIAGIFLMNQNKDYNAEYVAYKEEYNNHINSTLSEEELQAYEDKKVEYTNLLKELSDLGISKGGDMPTHTVIDNAIESLKKELEEEKAKLAKEDSKEVKEESKEEVKEETSIPSNSGDNSSSSSSGQDSQSTQKPSNTQNSTPVVEQKPVEQKPVEQPVVEQKPVEKPVVEEPVQPQYPAFDGTINSGGRTNGYLGGENDYTSWYPQVSSKSTVPSLLPSVNKAVQLLTMGFDENAIRSSFLNKTFNGYLITGVTVERYSVPKIVDGEVVFDYYDHLVNQGVANTPGGLFATVVGEYGHVSDELTTFFVKVTVQLSEM